MIEFTLGAIVRLNSESALKMTISKMYPPEHPIVPFASQARCECIWFDKDYKLNRADFNFESIRFV